ALLHQTSARERSRFTLRIFMVAHKMHKQRLRNLLCCREALSALRTFLVAAEQMEAERLPVWEELLVILTRGRLRELQRQLPTICRRAHKLLRSPIRKV